MTSTLPSDQFTAWAMCPVCSTVDLHWLREPRPPDPDVAPPPPAEPEETVINAFSGSVFRVVHRVPVGPVRIPDETVYEVIRTCRKCVQDWGQM